MIRHSVTFNMGIAPLCIINLDLFFFFMYVIRVFYTYSSISRPGRHGPVDCPRFGPSQLQHQGSGGTVVPRDQIQPLWPDMIEHYGKQHHLFTMWIKRKSFFLYVVVRIYAQMYCICQKTNYIQATMAFNMAVFGFLGFIPLLVS